VPQGDHLAAFNVAPIAPTRKGYSAYDNKVVSIDTVLDAIMSAWSDRREAAAKKDERRLLRATVAFDANNDGVLDFREFRKLIQRAEIAPSRVEMLSLYEETLARSLSIRKEVVALETVGRGVMSSAGFSADLPDAIDPQAFAEVVARRTRTSPPEFYTPHSKTLSTPTAAGSESFASKSHNRLYAEGAPSAAANSRLATPAAELTSQGLIRLDQNAVVVDKGRGSGAAADPILDAAEIELVVGTLASNFLFSSMSEKERKELVLGMERHESPPNTRLIDQGDSADYFYVLVAGTAEARVRDQSDAPESESVRDMATRLLGASGASKKDVSERRVMIYNAATVESRCFGELALLHSKPRAASIVCMSACIIYALSRRLFRATLRRSSYSLDLANALRKVPIFGGAAGAGAAAGVPDAPAAVHVPTWGGEEAGAAGEDEGGARGEEGGGREVGSGSELLAGSAALAELPASAMQRLSDTFVERSFEDGETLCIEGQPADAMYVLLSGFARVSQAHGGQQMELPGHLTESAVFGERMLSRSGFYTAAVTAVGYLRCAWLSRDVFEAALSESTVEAIYNTTPPTRVEMDSEWAVMGLRRYRLTNAPSTPAASADRKAPSGRRSAKKASGGGKTVSGR